MMTITLRNDFHNTTVDLRAASLPHTLTPSQERRVLRVLCGVTGCTCGGVRGPQYSPDGRRLTVGNSVCRHFCHLAAGVLVAVISATLLPLVQRRHAPHYLGGGLYW